MDLYASDVTHAPHPPMDYLETRLRGMAAERGLKSGPVRHVSSVPSRGGGVIHMAVMEIPDG